MCDTRRRPIRILAAGAALLGIWLSLGVASFASGKPGTLTTWPVPTANSVPNGLVVTEGGVYFTEAVGNKIASLDPTANSIREWDVGQGPYSLVAGPAGALYFTERNGDRIGCLASGGSYYSTESVGASGAEPLGLSLGLPGDNALWFVERGLGSVARLALGGLLFDVLQPRIPAVHAVSPTTTSLTPTTTTVVPHVTPGNPMLPPAIALAARGGSSPYALWTIPTSAYNLRDLVLAPGGNVFLSTETASILELAPDSNSVLFHDLPTGSVSLKLALDTSGRVWFTESRSDRIGRLDPSTGEVVEWPVPAGGQPFGIVLASDGTVWFAERERNQIGHLEPATNTLTEYPLPSNTYPVEVALDSSGQVWFTAERSNRIGRLAIGPTLGLPPLLVLDAITGVHVTFVSTTQARVTVDYLYSGGHGLPVYVGAFATRAGAQDAAFGFVPETIPTAGTGSVTVGLSYMGAGCDVTDGIQVFLHDATAGATFLTADIAYAANWGTCGPSGGLPSGLPTVSVSVDRACGGNYNPGDPITVSVTPSDTTTCTLIDFENAGTQKRTGLGIIPGGATASISGTITGPAGLETLVVMAQTTSGIWVSSGCTFSVDGVNPALVSISVDRGCGATYHYGETATAIIQSSVSGFARLYQVTRDGQVTAITALPIVAGLIERINAPIGPTTGTSTFILQMQSTSGQTLTASCSYSVLP